MIFSKEYIIGSIVPRWYFVYLYQWCIRNL